MHSALLWRAAVVACYAIQITSAQQAKEPASFSIDDVVQLNQAGVSEEVIIVRIKKAARAFDLTGPEIIELRKAGLSDNIIKYLLEPAQPYTPPPPPPKAEPPRAPVETPKTPKLPEVAYPPDPLAGKVPAKAGAYYFNGDTVVAMQQQTMTGGKMPGALGKVLTAGMKKGKPVAVLLERASATRFTAPDPVFYVRVGEKLAADDLALVVLDPEDNRREMAINPPDSPAAKPGPAADILRPLKPKQVGEDLFRLKPTELESAEYFIYIRGSADPTKGTQGRGYDFAIDLPAKEKRKDPTSK